MPPDVAIPPESYFLSYSRSDERFALRFAKDLRAHGVAMWVDQLDIRPSEHWDRAIERAVRDCRGVVVILSPRSVASDNVADEISFAIDSGKAVIPVMIERCSLPLRITRMHMIDATANYDRALQQCVAEIKRCGGAVGAGVEAVAVSRVMLDPEILATAERQLTSVIGPIAGILVDKAASRAASEKDLYGLLMLHIEGEADRERFAALTSRPQVPSEAAKPPAPSRAEADKESISSADIEMIGGILTSYLGPIAPIVAQRESQSSGSLDDLRQRLAAFITNEHDRAKFLQEMAAR